MGLKKIAAVFLFICLLSVPSAHAAKNKVTIQPEDIESITILAPTSMVAPITELCRIYSRKTRQDVNAVFDSSSENIANIEDGDPADIIITASKKWFDTLDRKGLVEPSTRKVLAKNKLVLARSRFLEVAQTNNIRSNFDAVYNKTLLVIADPAAEDLGEYTMQALLNLGLWDKFKSRAVLGASSFQAADLIIKGQSAGIIYSSDAQLYAVDLRVVSNISEKSHKPIEYLAAVVTGEDMPEAKDYLAFLASEEAKQIFRKYGFVVE